MRPNPAAKQPLAASLSAQILTQVHAEQFSATLNIDQALRQLPLLAHRYAISGVFTVESIRRANLALLINEVGSAAELASRMGVSPSQISQWKTGAKDSKTGKQRQLSSESCRKLEAAAGKDEGWMDQQHPSVAPALTGVAQELSDLKPDDELTPQPWEFILSAVILPKRFCVAVPDGALAPKSPKGTEFVFVSPPSGPPGESVAVIVQTASGQRCIRLYFAAGGGTWEARARDPAFPSFHSERDQLQLLAVATMRTGGEG